MLNLRSKTTQRHYTTAVLAGITFSLAASVANAKDYPLHLENELIAVCAAVKSDSKLKLNRAVKATGLNIRDLHEGLVCNGEDLLSFAATHNALKTQSLIAKRVNDKGTVLTAKR